MRSLSFLLVMASLAACTPPPRTIVPASFVLDDADRADIARAAAAWGDLLDGPVLVSDERTGADDYTIVLAPIPTEMHDDAYADAKTKTITIDPARVDRNRFYPLVLHEIGHSVGFRDLAGVVAVMNHSGPAASFTDADRAQCRTFQIRRCRAEFR